MRMLVLSKSEYELVKKNLINYINNNTKNIIILSCKQLENKIKGKVKIINEIYDNYGLVVLYIDDFNVFIDVINECII